MAVVSMFAVGLFVTACSIARLVLAIKWNQYGQSKNPTLRLCKSRYFVHRGVHGSFNLCLHAWNCKSAEAYLSEALRVSQKGIFIKRER